MRKLKFIYQIIKLYWKRDEILRKWQEIQQEEHNALFAFQLNGKRDDEIRYVYQKGIAEGVKWLLGVTDHG